MKVPYWKVCLAFWISGFAHIVQGVYSVLSLGTIRYPLVFHSARWCARHIYEVKQ